MPALDNIEFLIAAVQQNARGLINIAESLLIPNGLNERAVALIEQALIVGSGDPEIAALARDAKAKMVAGWYFSNLQDHPRHALYQRAFSQVFHDGCTVLDIGAGTGFMSMLAVRAGAGHVYACEKDPIVAELARQTVELNGYAKRITIIPKYSHELELGVDFEERADVLLWDNLSNNLFRQGALPAVEDARRRLIKPNAPIIPARCELRVALLEDLAPCDTIMGMIDGFDMTPFNKFRPTGFILDAATTRRISDVVTIFAVDFRDDKKVDPQQASVTVRTHGGRVHGIGQWLRFTLADDIIYDTGEDAGVRAFGTVFHAVDAFDVVAEEPVTIAGSHDRTRTRFWIAPTPERGAYQKMVGGEGLENLGKNG